MTVASATGTAATSAATTSGATSPAASQLANDYSMFLKLLTTQMQNQDPLNPMDTSEYTQQLVQYSQVEQAIEQTRTLKDILASMGTQDLVSASNLIGRDIEVNTPTAPLGDTPARWTWTQDGTARTVATLTATIRDAQGRVVETRALPPAASGRFDWDGTLSGGGTAAAGNYTLTLQATDAAGNAVPVTVHAIGRVDQILSDSGGVLFGMNGLTVAAGSVLRIAEAQNTAQDNVNTPAQ